MRYKIKQKENLGILHTIGDEFKKGAQFLSESLPNLGLNIPFDALRDFGVNVPVSIMSPTAYNEHINPKQNTLDFTKRLLNNAGEAATNLMAGELIGAGASKLLKKLPAVKKYAVEKAAPYALGEKKLPFNIKPTSHFQEFDTPYEEVIKNEYANKQRMLWRSQGHDVNMSDNDIVKIMDQRKAEILKSGPKKFLVDAPLKTSSNAGQITLYQRPHTKAYDTGFLNYFKPGPAEPGYMKIDFIKNMKNSNILPEHRMGVTTPLYQGLLTKAQQTGEKGFLSGNDYLMPEKTVPSIQKNFSTKVSEKVTGVRRYLENIKDFPEADMEDITELGEYRPKTYDNKVFKVQGFKTPMDIPMKSVLSASPNTKLDWTNKDIYKSILPPIVGVGYATKKASE